MLGVNAGRPKDQSTADGQGAVVSFTGRTPQLTFPSYRKPQQVSALQSLPVSLDDYRRAPFNISPTFAPLSPRAHELALHPC